MPNNRVSEFADQLENDIPGFIAFSICQIKTGKVIYSRTATSDFDIEMMTSSNVDFVKAKLNGLYASKVKDEIKNIIVNLQHQIHIIDITPDHEFFFYMAVASKKVNLAIVLSKFAKCKVLMKKTDD